MRVPDWPPWLILACLVAAAGLVIWILAKALKWVLWLVVIAALAAGAIAAARFLLK